MSFQITTAFVQQYRNNVIQLSQQKGSRFRGAVRLETDIVGKSYFFERIGATSAQVRTTRHGDTPLVSTPHTRRMVTLADYEWADLVDQADKIRLLIDPQSEYVQAGVNAMGRAMDDLIVAAATGYCYEGETGATQTPFDTGNYQVAEGSANLTLAKLAAAKRIIDSGDVDPDEPRYITVAPKEIEYLLVNVAEVKSADYSTVQALMKGEINQYYGFEWILSNRLAMSGSDRVCLAWAKNGLGLAIGADIRTEIDKRPDKSNSTQVYISMTLGATRIEDAKVVSILCLES